MSDFFRTYGMEIAGTLSSLIYLFYSIREKIWCWPWGIAASVISILVFFMANLYADMGLQFYYLFVSIYGWYFWLHGRNNGRGEAVVSTTTQKQWTFLILAGTVIYFFILALLLNVPQWLRITQSSMPYLDAFTTAASIIATWMLARKMLEQWLIWIVVDLVSMGMYVYKGLYFYAFLFLVYAIGAVVGYYEWRKSLTGILVPEKQRV
jgi:nicotinamide mononucleotide transporter